MTMHGKSSVKDVARGYWKASDVMLANRVCRRDAVMEDKRLACSDLVDMFVC